MADSTSPLQQITAGANADVRINENFDAVSPVSVYGRRASTTTGLTWGYYGGRWAGFLISSSTFSLTTSVINYVVVERATGITTCSTSATHWNDQTTYARAYKITAGASTITSYEDHRAGPCGAHGAADQAVFTGGTLTTSLNEAAPVTIASSTTPAIFAAAANTINMTGTVTVTGFDTIAAGARRSVVFSGILQLTHNATSMINLTAADITTEAGDIAEFESLGSGNTRMVGYERKSGAALLSSGSGTVTSVSVTTANGVSGSVATSTTTPAITLTLGAITPTSVAASGSVTGSNLSGTNTGNETTTTEGALINGATSKTTPVDADYIGLMDSAASNILKKLSWANLKASLLATVNVFSKNQSVTPYALTDGSTINTDASLSNNFEVTLGGNRTLANPTNPTAGMVCNWAISQDGTGSRTLAYGSAFDWGGAATPTLSTTASKVDFISAYYHSGTSKWIASFRKGT